MNHDDFLALLLYPSLRDRSPVTGERPRSLFEAMRRGLVPPKYMAEAREILRKLDERPRIPKTAMPARSLYNDPSWDNVIRALEEDR